MDKKKSLFILTLALATTLLYSQNRFGIFTYVNTGNTIDDSKNLEVITRSLGLNLEQIGFAPFNLGKIQNQISDFKIENLADSAYLAKLIAHAKENGCSYIILALYYLKENFLFLNYLTFDLKGNSLYSYSEQARTSLELYNRLSDAVDGMKIYLAKTVKIAKTDDQKPSSTILPEAKNYVQSIVLLSGDEGAEILLNKEVKLGVIVNGRLSLPYQPIKVGSKIIIEKRKEGYYPDVEEITLRNEIEEIRLRPLEKIVNHEGLLIYTIGQFIGIGLGYRYHFVPQKLFVGGENYLYFYIGSSLAAQTVIHNDLRVLVGLYILNVLGIPYKIELTTGLGLILTVLTIEPTPVFTDFYLNLLNISFGFRLGELEFYIREELKLTLGLGPNLLGFRLLLLNGISPLVSFGVKIPF